MNQSPNRHSPRSGFIVLAAASVDDKITVSYLDLLKQLALSADIGLTLLLKLVIF